MENMNRVATWDGIGTSIVGLGRNAHLAEALDKANLNYFVDKENITTASGLIVPGKQATIKHYTDGSTAVSGIVSPSYEIMQNIDAFSFVDNLVDEGVEIVKAGETYTGMVYLIGKMPEVTVLGDTFQPNIIFQNSHNGFKALAATICLLRIACQNQFASTFKNADNAIKLRHTRTLEQRLALSQDILREAYTYAKTFGDDAEQLAAIKISDVNINKAFDLMIGAAKEELSTRKENNIQDMRAAFINAYRAEDISDYRGTAWGALNAYTDFATHRDIKATEHGAERRFMDVSFGNDTAKFLNILRSVA